MKVKVAQISEIDEGEPYNVRVSPHLQIVLIKRDDKIYALNDECPHMGGPLGEGEIEDKEIICPWHFWRFNIETGECNSGGEEPVACYLVTVQGTDVYVTIPDEEE